MSQDAEKRFLGHPRGLYVLFGAEMWERFSFYGMRGLLVLYLTNHLRETRGTALDLYATYTGLVYLTPLLGGYVADRYLGQRKAILIGGLLMALGHFAMAFESLLSFALGLLILGNGFFKPNISTMVGQLYGPDDPRRDRGYTIFYMGINVGAFLAPLACGQLAQMYGYHWGFGLAGIGMVLGILNFSFFQRTLGYTGYAPGLSFEGEPRLRLADWLHVTLLTAIGTAGVWVALMPLPLLSETKYDVTLIESPADLSELPTEGEQRVIVADLGDTLHFRVFDDTGERIADLSESEIEGKENEIEMLRGRLDMPEEPTQRLWGLNELPERGRESIALAVTSIVGVQVRPLGAVPMKALILGFWFALSLAFVAIIRVVAGPSGQRRPHTGPDAGPVEAAQSGGVADAVEGGRGLSEAAGSHPKSTDSNAEEEDPNAPFTTAQWQRMAVIVILSVFSIVFWAGFEQSGGTLNLFADDKTDRTYPEFIQRLTGEEEFPTAWLQSVNPLLIVMLAPLFSMMWSALDRSRFSLNSAAKFGIGLIGLGLGMAVMYMAESRYESSSQRVGPQWLAMVYLIFTMSELCLSPIGLSLVNKLAPVRVASLMMALWFGCTAGANYLAGKLESYTGEGLDLWRFLIFFSIIPGVILLLMNPLLKKMSHGRI